MPQLILLRHGESVWNRDDRFTGWTDVDLSDTGIEEAHTAARMLTLHSITPDLCFTSVLKRAIRTLWIVLDDMDLMWLPVTRSWRLNERHYGALQGLYKQKMREEVGKERVHAWRRSYGVRPPALEPDDPRHPGHARRYADVPREELPATESLQDTVARVLPYWNETIAPRLAEGRVILLCAHGNSLRALIKHLDGIADDDIPGLEVPTGIPLLYELDVGLEPVKSQYLKAEAPQASQA
jgi:2,3-bisphosphoglycerate-dependent phosphoglycerate mutase